MVFQNHFCLKLQTAPFNHSHFVEDCQKNLIAPHFIMADQKEFESVYKERLELLVCGYSYENSGKISIPIVLLKCIEKWYNGPNEPKLKINVIDVHIPAHIECYFDNKVNNKLLNVNKYKLIYKPSKHALKFKSESTSINHINDKDHFIGFCRIRTKSTPIWSNQIFDFEVIAYDKDNNILVKLNKKLKLNNNSKRCYLYEPDIKIHWKCINNKDYYRYGPVVVGEWTKSVRKLLINCDFNWNELLFRRIFYYINWVNNRNGKIYRRDVELFIGKCEYLGQYKDFREFLESAL